MDVTLDVVTDAAQRVVLVVHGGGLMDTAYEYGLAVMVLSAIALVGSVRVPRPQR